MLIRDSSDDQLMTVWRREPIIKEKEPDDKVEEEIKLEEIPEEKIITEEKIPEEKIREEKPPEEKIPEEEKKEKVERIIVEKKDEAVQTDDDISSSDSIYSYSTILPYYIQRSFFYIYLMYLINHSASIIDMYQLIKKNHQERSKLCLVEHPSKMSKRKK